MSLETSCDCVSKLNDKLEGFNTKVAVAFCLSKDRAAMDVIPLIMTEKRVTTKRGKPRAVVASFCPFCGTRYKRADDGQDA